MSILLFGHNFLSLCVCVCETYIQIGSRIDSHIGSNEDVDSESATAWTGVSRSKQKSLTSYQNYSLGPRRVLFYYDLPPKIQITF